MTDTRRDLLVYGLLAVSILAVYGQSLNYGFVNYDDPHYVINNYPLHQGLTIESLKWAFTTGYAENWHPLTWLSHMLDFELYGMNPRAHRLTNILLHMVSAFVLFAALRKLTGAYWRSLAVAGLFALHPLHVESVVWLAERKDVLSGLFWMLALLAYERWVRVRSIRAYATVAIVLALGLMAKSMLVTLPCVFLLLDFWPLKRLEGASNFLRQSVRLAVEKIPFFMLSVIFSVTTFLVQEAGGTMKAVEVLPLWSRFANALIAYCVYIRKMFFPVDLAVLYPHPGEGVSIPLAILAAVYLVVVTGAAWLVRKRLPYVLVGWLWYLGTLVPVIGIVQVGDQAYADRYTYIPLIGLFIILAWGAPDAARLIARRSTRRIIGTTTAVVAAAWLALAVRQVQYWENSVTLFQRCLAVTEHNAPAHNNLGRAYHTRGDYDRAMNEYQKALSLMPNLIVARNNIGLVALELGRFETAVEAFESVVAQRPEDERFHLNLGIAHALRGELEKAETALRNALERAPDSPAIRYNLGLILRDQGEPAEAVEHLREAVRLQPAHLDARINLAKAYLELGNVDEGREELERILEIQPEHDEAQKLMAGANSGTTSFP